MRKTLFTLALAGMLLPTGFALAQTDAQAQAPVPAQVPATPPPAAAGAGTEWMQYKSPYAGEQNNLANPHRTNDEILAWASRAVAEAISFHAGKFEDEIKDTKKYFVQDGWKGYAGFLQDTKLLDVARSGKYSITSAADGDPMILGNGPVNGAYQWQVEVPIITSVTQTDDRGEQQTASSTRMRIQITLGRVPEEAGGDDGMAIVGWKMSPAAQ